MIKTMEPWELMSVVMRARDEDVLDMVTMDGVDPQRWACKVALSDGLAFTVMGSKGPVACLGFSEDAKGVSTVWMVATPEWCHHVKSVARTVKTVMKEGGYRRIQTMVNPERLGAEKFISWLGFSRDGPLPKMRPDGSAMVLYSFTR